LGISKLVVIVINLSSSKRYSIYRFWEKKCWKCFWSHCEV